MNYKHNPKLTRYIVLSLPFVFPFIFQIFVEEPIESKFAINTIYELMVLALLTIVCRRSFCGFFCLAGAVQRGLRLLGLKISKKHVRVPSHIDRYFILTKYLLMAALIFLILGTGESWFRTILHWLTTVIIVITLASSLFTNRPFCRYLCVLGSFLGVVSKISLSSIQRQDDLCIKCKLCSKNCPASLDISSMTKVSSPECLSCQACINVCPKPGALTNALVSTPISVIAVIFLAIITYIAATFAVSVLF